MAGAFRRRDRRRGIRHDDVLHVIDAILDVIDAVIDVIDAVIDVIDASLDVIDAVLDVIDASSTSSTGTERRGPSTV